MSTPAQPVAYTDAEVSSLLRVSKRTVYRLRKSGALRAVRIGRAVRTPAEEISRLLDTAQVRVFESLRPHFGVSGPANSLNLRGEKSAS